MAPVRADGGLGREDADGRGRWTDESAETGKAGTKQTRPKGTEWVHGAERTLCSMLANPFVSADEETTSQEGEWLDHRLNARPVSGPGLPPHRAGNPAREAEQAGGEGEGQEKRGSAEEGEEREGEGPRRGKGGQEGMRRT